MKQKELEYCQKELLDYYDFKIENNMLAEKRLQAKIIDLVKKNLQRQYIFHYLTKHAGRGVRGNIKRLYQVDFNNKIISTFLDCKSIKEEIIKYNKHHFQKAHNTEVYKDKIYVKL